jgi:hypothetical protein
MTRVARACVAPFVVAISLVSACGDDTTTSTSTSTSTSASSVAASSVASSSSGGEGGSGGAGGGATGGGGSGGTAACDDPLPDSYEGAAFEMNASVEFDVRSRFNTFVNLMQTVEASLVITPTVAQFMEL